MTCSILVDGVEQAGAIDLPGLQSVSARADGSYTDSGIAIDDPAGSEEFVQLSQVVIEEDDSTQPRAFTGYLHRSSISRGTYRDGPSRVHVLEVADLNFLLHLRVFTGATGKRPLESFNARIAWLLGSVALDGLVFDDGLVASNTDEFDEADYRGRYADDVLSEIAGTLGMIFFVRWDPTAGHPSLFCDIPTAAVHESTLKISNVLSDVDGTTTFAPSTDSEVTGAGEDIYDGIDIQAVGISIYRQNATTYAEFGIHRDYAFETTRIGRLATAERYAVDFLANHSGQIDTITCAIRLPSDKLTLIEAGMRMQVRFSHLPGYETDTWVRVTAMSFTFTPGRNDFYEVQLELSNRSLTASGVGSPGDFPNPPPTPGQEHWYDVTLSAHTDNHGPSVTVLDPGPGADLLFNTDYDWQVEVLSDTITGTSSTISFRLLDSTNSIVGVGLTSFPNPVVAPLNGTFNSGASFSNPARWRLELTHNDTADADCTVRFWLDPDGWVPIPPSSGAPAPGQWVYAEVVTMTGDDGTTAWPFATGSLRVFVDNVEQTANLVAQDGATGDFTLGFTPTPTEIVTVQYQGI